jgi:hypothetical protein
MSSNNRRIIFNTRERLLSSDLNDMQALLHAKGTDELMAALSGEVYKGALPLSGVIQGGNVTANGVDNTISISPILAIKHGSGATSYDSPYLKIETLVTATIDLTPHVDPSPRWVAIEVAPGDVTEVSSTRDEFQPALGTFLPVSVDKVRRPEPVFSVNAGTPSATPVLPLGTAGTIPLAYVYIPGGGTPLTTDVISCRAMIGSGSTAGVLLRGKGGLNVTAAGTDIAEVASTFAAKFLLQHAIVSVPTGITSDASLASSPNWLTGESLTADSPAYLYVAMAPYPAGYDSDVASNREFIDVSTRLPSNPTAGVLNGILFWSTTPPTIGVDNPIGRHPSGAAVTLTDPAWNSGTTNFHAYIGAVSNQSIAPAGLATQVTRGDRVRITESAKVPESYDQQTNTSALTQAGTFRNRRPMLTDTGGTKATGVVMPQAYEWDVAIENSSGPPASTGYAISVISAVYGNEEPRDATALNESQMVFEHENGGNDTFRFRRQYQIRTDAAGTFTWDHGSGAGTGASVMIMMTLGYQDWTLSLR